jgi:2-dehydro-3-deoxygluconokinase
MDSGLHVRPDGALDLLSLGALVTRFDPGVVPFRKAEHCDIHVSGGEFNVAANLADCFGMRTGIASAMVDYPIGELVAERVQSMGVVPFYRRYPHDGVTGPNIATVYSDRGHGVRAPVVFYNRANEAAARLRVGDFDWPAILAPGVRWFHSGGIFAALSETTAELMVDGMRAARSTGAVVSFDVNFREKLWAASGGDGRAREVLGRIVENVDVLVGNEEDLQVGLGIPGPRIDAGAALDSSWFGEMIERVLERYPRIRVVATSLRDVRSANRHGWGAVAWIDGGIHVAPTCDLDVLDRVGGGDGFAAGLFYGLLAGEAPGDALRLGWAHGALVATYPGDTTMATLAQVRTVAAGGSARIKR